MSIFSGIFRVDSKAASTSTSLLSFIWNVCRLQKYWERWRRAADTWFWWPQSTSLCWAASSIWLAFLPKIAVSAFLIPISLWANFWLQCNRGHLWRSLCAPWYFGLFVPVGTHKMLRDHLRRTSHSGGIIKRVGPLYYKNRWINM